MDFIAACDKCGDLKLSYNLELVEQLKVEINYERPEWSKIANFSEGALAPFNDETDCGMGIALHGSLLAPQIDQGIITKIDKGLFE